MYKIMTAALLAKQGPVTTDPANLRVLAPPNPGGVVVNVVYADVLEVGEARMALD